MQSTLLVHVPKTGGTTLDDLLGEGGDVRTSLRRVQHDAPISDWERLDDPTFTFVSGHVPAGALDLGRYAQRITILRAPLDLVASLDSYQKRYFPALQGAAQATGGQERASIYGLYFSPGYDCVRYLAERRYGVSGPPGDYVDRCTVNDALEVLARFDRVIDYAQLEGELKRLTVELGLFPRAALPRLRHYAYQPDLQGAAERVSYFDVSFYRRAQRHFRALPDDIDAVYQRYREDYCRSHGWRLAQRTTQTLALAGALGNGWFRVEQATTGAWFRWANGPRPTLEIPVAEPGVYQVTMYVHPHAVRGLRAKGRAEIAGRRFVVHASEREGVTVLQGQVRLQTADWLHLQFDADEAAPATGQDLVVRSFVLGRVLLRRGAG